MNVWVYRSMFNPQNRSYFAGAVKVLKSSDTWVKTSETKVKLTVSWF